MMRATIECLGLTMRIVSTSQLAQLGSQSAPWRWIISNRRGRKPVPYVFTTPYKLLEDFFAEVDKILKKEGVS